MRSFKRVDGRIEAVLEAFPAEIVSGEGRRRILACVRELPPCALQSTFGFESHLDEAAPYCDLFLSAPVKSPLLRYFGELGSKEDEALVRLGVPQVAKQIESPMSALASWAQAIILEYDLCVRPWSESRTPGYFVARSAKSADDRCNQHFDDANLKHDARLMKSVISCVIGEHSVPYQQAMDIALCTLPAGSRVVHVGVLPERVATGVRLVLSLPRPEASSYLQLLGWGGSFTDFSRVLRLIEDRCGGRRVYLSLEVSHRGVSDRVGIDLYLKHPWHSVPAKCWEPCLRHFVEAGWSRKEKAEGLLRWPRTDMVFSDQGSFKLLTGINHLKLTLEAGRVRSKAYMGAYLFPQ